jgi:16S rRNA processing protein RimM
MNDLVELGACRKPHGIKGGFHFHLYNTEESVLKEGIEVTLFPESAQSSIPEEGKKYSISKISFGNKIIAYLDDISDRNIVEDIIPFKIFVDRSIFPETKDGEFYVTDLIGADVFNCETGDKVGTLHDYYDNGQQIVFVIKTEDDMLDLPFTKQFFPLVDIENKRIEILVPEVIE